MKALIAWVALASVIAGIPAAALAQTGWVVLPSFSLAEEFDDNVFAYQKQADTSLPHNIVTLSLDIVYPVRVAP
jgi:hypothetical protein